MPIPLRSVDPVRRCLDGYPATANPVHQLASVLKACSMRLYLSLTASIGTPVMPVSGNNTMDSQDAFIPLHFKPGEAYQFDWSHETVVLGGITQR